MNLDLQPVAANLGAGIGCLRSLGELARVLRKYAAIAFALALRAVRVRVFRVVVAIAARRFRLRESTILRLKAGTLELDVGPLVAVVLAVAEPAAGAAVLDEFVGVDRGDFPQLLNYLVLNALEPLGTLVGEVVDVGFDVGDLHDLCAIAALT